MQLLLLLGKPLNALLNTVGYFLLAYFVDCYAFPKRKKLDTLLIILSILYFINPIFSETVLWYTGTGNYLWTTIIVLISFRPYYKLVKNSSYQLNIFDKICLCLSCFAGWSNENISVSILIINAIILWKSETKNKWFYLSYIFLLIGSILLIAAPGNQIRSATFSSNILLSLMFRIHGQINAWFNWLIAINLLFIFAYFVAKKLDIEIKFENKIMVVWYLLSVLVMFASPSYPQRATFGSFIILLIPTLNILGRFIDKIDKRIYRIVAILLIVSFCANLLSISALAFARNVLGMVI